MKKIALDEEFSAVGGIYVFTNKEGKIVLQRVRNAGKTKEFVPPTLLEVTGYFTIHGYTKESAEKFYNYYNPEWKDSNDKPVKKWEQKARGIWFKEENKVKKEPVKDNKKEGKFMF